VLTVKTVWNRKSTPHSAQKFSESLPHRRC